MREEKSTRRRGLPCRGLRGECHGERDSGELGVGRGFRGEGCECRVRLVNRMTEPARDLQSDPIASGLGNREPTARDDDRVDVERRLVLQNDAPAILLERQYATDPGVSAKSRALARG